MTAKAALKKVTPPFLWRAIRTMTRPGPGRRSFAQEGEDLILASLFGHVEGAMTPGFYVDVGAYDPRVHSNTYFFYLRGWHGINIDARPGSMDGFQRLRPRDRNIEAAISSVPAALTYYEFSEPTLNGFDPDITALREKDSRFRVIGTRAMQSRTLAEVLAAELPHGQHVDFLTVDVEGLDFEVLKSLDWNKVMPSVALVEGPPCSTMTDLVQSPVHQFLVDLKYVPVCRTPLTVFYVFERALLKTPVGLRIDRHWNA